MKKIAPIAAIALLGIIVLPSCKKDYTCACTYTDANGDQQTIDVPMDHVTKKDAKSACNAASATYSAFTGVECKLK